MIADWQFVRFGLFVSAVVVTYWLAFRWVLDHYGERWESGFFDEHGVKLVVSRGLGCEPGISEMRFCCSPEVVVIDLIGRAPSVTQH